MLFWCKRRLYWHDIACINILGGGAAVIIKSGPSVLRQRKQAELEFRRSTRDIWTPQLDTCRRVDYEPECWNATLFSDSSPDARSTEMLPV